jgi:hypothetical protein
MLGLATISGHPGLWIISVSPRWENGWSGDMDAKGLMKRNEWESTYRNVNLIFERRIKK